MYCKPSHMYKNIAWWKQWCNQLEALKALFGLSFSVLVGVSWFLETKSEPEQKCSQVNPSLMDIWKTPEMSSLVTSIMSSVTTCRVLLSCLVGIKWYHRDGKQGQVCFMIQNIWPAFLKNNKKRKIEVKGNFQIKRQLRTSSACPNVTTLFQFLFKEAMKICVHT